MMPKPTAPVREMRDRHASRSAAHGGEEAADATGTLLLLPDEDACNATIARHIAGVDSRGESLRILEAGCGQRWLIDLEGIEFKLVGVDLDPAALDIRLKQNADLDEAIVGDLQTVELPANHFDVIYSSFVLEHVERAHLVLENFVRWLKPGGVVVVRVPDRNSFRGLLTRLSPHWFHVWYYRFILHNHNAGRPGFAPYPTYYDPVISRIGMRSFCRDHGLSLRMECGDGSESYGCPGWAATTAEFVARAVSAAAGGRVAWKHANLLYILRKDAPDRS